MSRSGPDPEFDFTSRWQLSTGLETVWEALVDFNNWPEWWPGLDSVEETEPGDGDGIGQNAVSRWRGPLGYKIDFSIEVTELRFPECLKGKASGDLSGSGTWQISSVADLQNPEIIWTKIDYEWHVFATKRWMQLLDPVARPLFVFGHNHVMKQGAEGLAEYLNCELRDFATG